jgi:hypothetical protein
MDRRKALSLTATAMGGTIIGSELFLSGCTNPAKQEFLFSGEDIALLDEIGETILPASSESPGAKEARIGTFMKHIVNDCYSQEESLIFQSGLKELQEAAKSTFGSDFVSIEAQDRHALLLKFDAEAKEHANGLHFFTMMKQLTIWGYFTSESGATKALRYNQIPGHYEGCLPYKSGEKAWA